MIKLCAFADEYGKQITDQIEGLTLNNIHFVETRNVDGKNIADITDEEAENCYKRLVAAGISVWSLGSPMGKVDIDCDFEEYKVKRVIVCVTSQTFCTQTKYVCSVSSMHTTSAKR